MNKISLESFKKEVTQIKEYLKHIQYVSELLGYSVPIDDINQIGKLFDDLKNHDRVFGTDRKIFEYKASIISLYGLLEKYIEIWVKEYLESLSCVIPDYNNIDKKIRDNHFELSLKLVNIILHRENPKYQHLTKEKILANLNQCIVNPSNYMFNADAFTIPSGNLKHKQIVRIFELINVNLNEALKKNATIIQHIQNEQQITNLANLETDVLYNKINDLVERRNQIAHGSEVLEILGISELKSYIHFLEKYCQAIFEVLSENFIRQESIYSFQKIERIIEVIANRILVFEIENFAIKVGDIIIVETADGAFYKKHILTIQLDNNPYNEFATVDKVKIAISVEPKIKDTQTFYVVKQNRQFSP
jgi:RiboL-PSP-HEPN